MKVYLDNDFKCHVLDDGTMMAVETDFFDGKCAAFIEGYRFVSRGFAWTRADGEVFCGEMIVPWKPWDVLNTAQREYERQEAADMKEALALLGVNVYE